MNARILEVFESIQGEGKYAGVSQVFVRFFECNMHCVWCDTPHSIGDTSKRYTEFSLEELLELIENSWRESHSLTLTGGEPMMQSAFINQMLPECQKRNWPVHLETNGIFYKELETIIEGIDVIAMDIKLPSSTKCNPYWEEHARFLEIADTKDVFVKTVISNDTSEADIEEACKVVKAVSSDILFILQPNTYELKDGVMEKTLAFYRKCSEDLTNVRILPQVHKFLKIR